MFDNRSSDDVDVAELAGAERITDPAAVYDDVESLPEWWRALVYEFEEHDLRPYQPSRLADGEVVYEVVRDLEDRFDVRITIKSDDPTREGTWKFVVDGATVVLTTHERKAAGYTKYGVTTEELVDAVSDAVSESS